MPKRRGRRQGGRRKGNRRQGRRQPTGLQVIRGGPGGQSFHSRTLYRLNAQTTINVTNAAALYGNQRFVPTNVFQWDPLGATSTPFFSVLQATYRFYRVLSFTAVARITNREAFSVMAWLCPLNYDPGANTATFQPILSNPNWGRSSN